MDLEDFEVDFDLGDFLQNGDCPQPAAQVSHPIASPSVVAADHRPVFEPIDPDQWDVPHFDLGDFHGGSSTATTSKRSVRVGDEYEEDRVQKKAKSVIEDIGFLDDGNAMAEKICGGRLGYTIPGPAGALQMGIKKSQPCAFSCTDDSVDASSEFQSPAWISGLRYCHINEVDPAKYSRHISTISQIKSSVGIDRIPQLLAVILSCTPNGCGDAFVTLKDPTGTIGGTIHKRLLAETEFGRDIVPQAVVLLCKVTVFRPSPRAQYLNITMHNVVQVFRT